MFLTCCFFAIDSLSMEMIKKIAWISPEICVRIWDVLYI